MAGRTSAGFSLLEMVVALSILAFALAALYQATAGATRNISTDEKYAYGVELARSLLAENGQVPVNGRNAAGETSGGFNWYVKTSPINFPQSSGQGVSLHEIQVGVNWMAAGRQREVVLNSVVEGYEE